MRSLVFLIVISAFLLWFGLSFQRTKGRLAKASLAIGIILAIFIIIGVLRLV